MYMPSTETIREWVIEDSGEYEDLVGDWFDAWLAAEEARIRADERRRIGEAIREAVDDPTYAWRPAWFIDGMEEAADIAEGTP